MAGLRIGTCSWKYPSWQGIVYSKVEGINYLKEYAQHFNTVEVDQWFWSLFGKDNIRLPHASDVEDYRKSVPDDFKFTVKVPNSITLTHFHTQTKKEPLVANPAFLSVPLFKKFLSLLAPMKDVLGPVMFQFEYLNKKKMGSQEGFQELFEAFVKQLPDSIQYGVEIRNGNYLNASYFEFLNRNKLVPVLLEGYWMPSVVEICEKWKANILETETLVIRLHGNDRQEIEKTTEEKWDKIVAPKEEALKEIVVLLKTLVKRGKLVYVNANNHYEGSAPLTIENIKRLMR